MVFLYSYGIYSSPLPSKVRIHGKVQNVCLFHHIFVLWIFQGEFLYQNIKIKKIRGIGHSKGNGIIKLENIC